MSYQTITKHSKLIKIMVRNLVYLYIHTKSALAAYDFQHSWCNLHFRTVGLVQSVVIQETINELLRGGVFSKESEQEIQSYLSNLDAHILELKKQPNETKKTP